MIFSAPIWLWVGFNAFVLAMLALDLGVFHRTTHTVHTFYYLRLGLAVVLTYVGVKMVLTDFYHIPPALSLLVIALVLSIAIVASLLRVRRVSEPAEQHGQQETVVPLKKRSVSMQDSREHRRSSS